MLRDFFSFVLTVGGFTVLALIAANALTGGVTAETPYLGAWLAGGFVAFVGGFLISRH